MRMREIIITMPRRKRKNICAVGTTVMRAIESSVSIEALVETEEGWSNKFIFLLTSLVWPTHDLNFHRRSPIY